MKFVSWNVNGIRSVKRKGVLKEFFEKKMNVDVLCIQETKAHPDQLGEELLKVEGFNVYFSSAEKKGYSGVAVYSRKKPLKVEYDLGVTKFDREGRMIKMIFNDFVLYNVYFPNGKASDERLSFKLEFYEKFYAEIKNVLKLGKDVIVCGDVNTAHKEIDLARPKNNEKISGFLKEERDWIDSFLKLGFFDSFRFFDSSDGKYTWWSARTRARERNVGWRIDYFFVSNSFKNKIKDAFIMDNYKGSDHCPIGIEF